MPAARLLDHISPIYSSVRRMGYDTDYICCVRFNKPFTKPLLGAFKRLQNFSKHGSSKFPKGELWFTVRAFVLQIQTQRVL